MIKHEAPVSRTVTVSFGSVSPLRQQCSMAWFLLMGHCHARCGAAIEMSFYAELREAAAWEDRSIECVSREKGMPSSLMHAACVPVSSMGDFYPLVLLSQYWLTSTLAIFLGIDCLEADHGWDRKHACTHRGKSQLLFLGRGVIWYLSCTWSFWAVQQSWETLERSNDKYGSPVW